MRILLLAAIAMMISQSARAATVTYQISGRIAASVSSQVVTQFTDPELSGLVGQRFTYAATVDPDAPVSQSGGTVFSFSGTTTVRIGNVTFAQSEDRALETSSVNGFGFPFSGDINLDDFSASPDLSSFETVEAGFTFTTTGTIASASTLPGRSDIETYDSGLLGFFAKEDQVRGQLFQALGVIDRVSIDGEAFAFEGDLSADFGAAAVPLPDSMQLMLLGLGGLFFARREVTA